MTTDTPSPYTPEAVAEIFRRHKIDQVTEHGDDPDESAADIRGTVVVVQKGEPVALFLQGEGDTAMRECVYWAAALGQADVLYVCTDARLRFYDKLESGERPDPPLGQFQRDWEAGQREGLTECLVVFAIPVEGKPSMEVFPYAREGKHLQWLERRSGIDNVEGAIVDNAQAGFASHKKNAISVQTLADWATEFGLTPEEQRYHYLQAVGRYASTQKGVGGVAVLFGDRKYVDGQEVTT